MVNQKPSDTIVFDFAVYIESRKLDMLSTRPSFYPDFFLILI